MLVNFNIKKSAFLEIKIKNKINQKLTLFFNLLNSKLTDRWIELVDQNNNKKNEIVFSYKRIFNENEIINMLSDFKKSISYINENYDRKLIENFDINDLKNNYHILNDLHEEFELYGERIVELKEKKIFSENLEDNFLLLNNLIHNFESIIRSNNESCSCLIDFKPYNLFCDLKDEDYFLFTPEITWGTLYLGYNTLGKNWFNALLDNDIDILKRKKIVSQEKFAAECYLNFMNNKIPSYYNNYNFYNWWIKNSISDFYNPNMTIKDFAFGYIPLGFLSSYEIENKRFFLSDNFDKEKWNMEVWSNFEEICEFKITKTDCFISQKILK